MSGEGLRVADIGTGSGCIAIALAKELPEANICAVDISRAALAVAQRNATRLGFSNRITFLESDLFAGLDTERARYAVPLQEKTALRDVHESPVTNHQSPITGLQSPPFDLIVSNPPYIARREAATLTLEVRNHEPAIALFGGEEGYELYADLITQSAAHLKPGGILVLELGHDSLPAVEPLFDTPHWTNIGVTNDLAGIPRVLSAEHTVTQVKQNEFSSALKTQPFNHVGIREAARPCRSTIESLPCVHLRPGTRDTPSLRRNQRWKNANSAFPARAARRPVTFASSRWQAPRR